MSFFFPSRTEHPERLIADDREISMLLWVLAAELATLALTVGAAAYTIIGA